MVCKGVGSVVIIGSAITIIEATLLETLPHPKPVKVTTP